MKKTEEREKGQNLVRPNQRAADIALAWMYGITGLYFLFGFVFCIIVLYNLTLTTKILFGIFMGFLVVMWAYIEAVHGEALLRKERTYLRMIGTSLLSTGLVTILLAIFKPNIAFHYSVLSQILIAGTIVVVFCIVTWFGATPKLQRYLL